MVVQSIFFLTDRAPAKTASLNKKKMSQTFFCNRNNGFVSVKIYHTCPYISGICMVMVGAHNAIVKSRYKFSKDFLTYSVFLIVYPDKCFDKVHINT